MSFLLKQAACPHIAFRHSQPAVWARSGLLIYRQRHCAARGCNLLGLSWPLKLLIFGTVPMEPVRVVFSRVVRESSTRHHLNYTQLWLHAIISQKPRYCWLVFVFTVIDKVWWPTECWAFDIMYFCARQRFTHEIKAGKSIVSFRGVFSHPRVINKDNSNFEKLTNIVKHIVYIGVIDHAEYNSGFFLGLLIHCHLGYFCWKLEEMLKD